MTFFRRKIAMALTGTFCIFSPALAHAEEGSGGTVNVTANEGKRQFRADYFEAYAPVTALDMIRRIPGFTIAEGEGRRGFGENAGKVLSEGDHHCSKYEINF